MLGLPFVLVSGLTVVKVVVKLIIINIVVLLGSVTTSFYWIYKRTPADMIKEVGA